MPQNIASLIFIPQTYVVTSATISASGSNVQPLTVDADGDFELHSIFGTSNQDSPDDVRPNNFSVIITDKSNGRQWSDAAIFQPVISQVPAGWVMKRPVMIARRTQLSVQYNNLITDDTIIATVHFVGFKVQQAPASNIG